MKFDNLLVVAFQLFDEPLSPQLEGFLVLSSLLLDDAVVLFEDLGHLGVPLERLRVQLHLGGRKLEFTGLEQALEGSCLVQP